MTKKNCDLFFHLVAALDFPERSVLESKEVAHSVLHLSPDDFASLLMLTNQIVACHKLIGTDPFDLLQDAIRAYLPHAAALLAEMLVTKGSPAWLVPFNERLQLLAKVTAQFASVVTAMRARCAAADELNVVESEDLNQLLLQVQCLPTLYRQKAEKITGIVLLVIAAVFALLGAVLLLSTPFLLPSWLLSLGMVSGLSPWLTPAVLLSGFAVGGAILLSAVEMAKCGGRMLQTFFCLQNTKNAVQAFVAGQFKFFKAKKKVVTAAAAENSVSQSANDLDAYSLSLSKLKR